MSSRNTASRIHSWLVEPMSAEVADSVHRLSALEDVRYVAVMPDVHLANEVCVGLAVATHELIYPAAVGNDIGCGMAAIRFEADADLLADERAAARVLAGMYRSIPALKHPRGAVSTAAGDFLRGAHLSDARLEKLKEREGLLQFGTLGRGNHFVELQKDEENRLWLMVHSGSRGMGQAITAHHLKRAATDRAGSKGSLLSIAAGSAWGEAYLADVAWAIRYAEQNRLAMVAAVERLFEELFRVGVDRTSLIHANHNHVRRETHFGESFWVHRKGALSAAEGESGVIPGSMGTASFHVSGRGETVSLGSSSHGAGRRLSRADASRTIAGRQVEREFAGVWFDNRHTEQMREEAPSAYKDIHAVMRAQRDLTRIERQLRPLLSYKAF